MSAGVMVAARSHIGISNIDNFDLMTRDMDPARFCIKHIGGVCKGGLHLGSIYLHHNIGVDGAEHEVLLKAVGNALEIMEGPWIIGGDWNDTPEALTASGWLERVQGVAIPVPNATCNGKVYDFFVVSKCFAHAVVAARRIGDELWWPHSPVRLWIRACARSLYVRQLSAPKGFGAVLPYGPCQQHELEDGAEHIACGDAVGDIDAAAAQVLELMEGQLSKICGHDGKETSKHDGRAEGPSFKWMNPCGAPGTGRPARTPTGRAWRLIGGWLRRIAASWVEARALWRAQQGKGDEGGDEDMTQQGGQAKTPAAAKRRRPNQSPEQIRSDAQNDYWRLFHYDFRIPYASAAWGSFLGT